MSRLARPSAGGVQQQNAQPRHRQFGRVRAAGGFTYCDQTSAEEVRSPRLSFGAAVESWRVRSLCVQIPTRPERRRHALLPAGHRAAPHRALQMVRENLDYLERFLGPQSGHDPGSHGPAEAQGSISPGSRPDRAGQQRVLVPHRSLGGQVKIIADCPTSAPCSDVFSATSRDHLVLE
jgi:hypothetical protein